MQNNKLNSLTGLRYIAAVLVYFSHTSAGYEKSKFSLLLAEGYIGVSFFFILSGFILSYSYGEKITTNSISFKKFLLLRFVRIFPVNFLLSIPFLLWYYLSNANSVLKYLLNIFFLESWIPLRDFYFSYNSPAWSLSNEIFFYGAFFYLVKISNASRFKIFTRLLFCVVMCATVFSLLTVGAIGSEVDSFQKWLFYIFPVFRLIEFMLGMYIYDLWIKNGLSRIKYTSISIPLVVLAMLLSQWIPESFRWSLFYMPFMAFILISYIGKENNVSGRILSSSLMVRLGEASFSFYLIHFPIILLAGRLIKIPLGYEFLFHMGLLVFISLVSMAVFAFFERPVHRYLVARINRI